MNSETVYLAGPKSGKWRASFKEHASGIHFIDPFAIHREGASDVEILERDLWAVRSSDAVLVRRIEDYEICGAYIEAGYAFAHGVPVFVWNDADSPVPEFLVWTATDVFPTYEGAIDTIE